MITHDGIHIPTAPEGWDPSNTEWVTFGWAESVALYGAMTASSWTLPDGWEEIDTRQDVTVEDVDGKEHANANQLKTKFSGDKGRYTLTNKVTFSDGTILERSVHMIVKDT